MCEKCMQAAGEAAPNIIKALEDGCPPAVYPVAIAIALIALTNGDKAAIAELLITISDIVDEAEMVRMQ